MKKSTTILASAALAGCGLFAFSAPSFAGENHPAGATSTADPHHEEADGCDHGATGKPCRPDPQPMHGKDCQKHGNHGGINEDHCAATNSPTDNPTGAPSTSPSPTSASAHSSPAPTPSTSSPAKVNLAPAAQPAIPALVQTDSTPGSDNTGSLLGLGVVSALGVGAFGYRRFKGTAR